MGLKAVVVCICCWSAAFLVKKTQCTVQGALVARVHMSIAQTISSRGNGRAAVCQVGALWSGLWNGTGSADKCLAEVALSRAIRAAIVPRASYQALAAIIALAICFQSKRIVADHNLSIQSNFPFRCRSQFKVAAQVRKSSPLLRQQSCVSRWRHGASIHQHNPLCARNGETLAR